MTFGIQVFSIYSISRVLRPTAQVAQFFDFARCVCDIAKTTIAQLVANFQRASYLSIEVSHFNGVHRG